MTRKKCSLGTALLTLVWVGTANAGGLNAAQQSALNQRLACISKRMTRRMLKLDTNKDGKIDPAERKVARAARKKAMLTTYDLNRDGKLDRQERAQKRHDRMVKRFEKLDLNADAEISTAELKNSCSRVARHFTGLDLDKNGRVTWVEYEAGMKKFKRRFRRHWRRGFRHHKGNLQK